MNLFTRFSFHPVGQGIFSTGSISTSMPDLTEFAWAYDCGSVKRWQKQLEQEITRFEGLARRGMSCLGLKPKLDLVFVSHFDLDHISGLVKLLQAFEVDTLVLPYIPLWQRVVAAFKSTRFDNPSAQALFANPVGFVSGIEGSNIARILLVPPSTGQAEGGGGPRQDGPKRDSPGDSSNNPPLIVSAVGGPPFEDVHPEECGGLHALGGNAWRRGAPQVQWLAPGGRLVAAGCWEFVPYNDPTPGLKATPAFRLAVRRMASVLLSGAPAARGAILGKLKTIYAARFGTSSKNKNEISLFVFAGPTARARCSAATASFPSLATAPGTGGTPCDSGQCPICSVPVGGLMKPGILYTGDGFLATRAQIASLSGYLGTRRMSSIGTLQVMHHGSRTNWRPGLASLMAPHQSVFCADGRHVHRHPHREVWDDFEAFGSVLVDAKIGMTRFQRC